jgi:hypothetical protein
MSRPGVVALLSAVVASIAAFSVLKGWGLYGTLAGAALFPFVYNLVSHLSGRGINQTVTALRKRSGQGEKTPDENEPSPPEHVSIDDAPRAEPPIPAWTRWLSIGLACMALGIGLYSILTDSPTEQVIVRERVIEREVAAATEPALSSDQSPAPHPDTSPTTTTSTDPTTSTTDQRASDTESITTTATASSTTVESEGTAGDVTTQDPQAGSVSTATTSGSGDRTPTINPPPSTTP